MRKTLLVLVALASLAACGPSAHTEYMQEREDIVLRRQRSREGMRLCLHSRPTCTPEEAAQYQLEVDRYSDEIERLDAHWGVVSAEEQDARDRRNAVSRGLEAAQPRTTAPASACQQQSDCAIGLRCEKQLGAAFGNCI
jgi:hypothetical protein